jgi:predicted nucleic acid-binding protein
VRGWLLDTNIVSELRRPKPAAAVAEFVATQPGESLFTTEVTFGEIRFGIEQLEDAGRRADIHLWLDRTLRPLFGNRVLAITEDVIVRWKAMVFEGQKRGHTFGQPDLFIAAIAALEDLVVVTRDTGCRPQAQQAADASTPDLDSGACSFRPLLASSATPAAKSQQNVPADAK